MRGSDGALEFCCLYARSCIGVSNVFRLISDKMEQGELSGRLQSAEEVKICICQSLRRSPPSTADPQK